MTTMSEFHKQFFNKSRETATEGIVLLKNERGTLPFKEKDVVSVFGRPQIDYYRSGTGSGGSVYVEETTNILDGFKNSGININNELVDAYKAWLRTHPFDNGGGGWAAEPWFQYDMPITYNFAAEMARHSNKAVYIIGRTAGEDRDNYLVEGSYQLTALEKENLVAITQAFKQVCVIFNVSNIIDMGWIADERMGEIDSMVYVWQGGNAGGLAIGDVLSGNISPSGKMPDTIAWDIHDYPSTENFGHDFFNLYKEDIYVGYRYFETFAPDKVMYEFGFGLSYTEFDVSVLKAEKVGDELIFNVEVTNIGKKYSGKEVVQVYVEAPQGALGQPKRKLAGFAKTDEIAPGDSQQVEVRFTMEELASYDDSNATGHKSCYVLEAGDYNFYVGTSVRDNILSHTETIDELIVVEELSECCAPDNDDLEILKPGKLKEDGTYEETYVPSEHPTVDLEKRIEENLPEEIPQTDDKGIKLKDVYDGKAELKDFIAQLTVEELAQMIRGEGMSNPRVTMGTASAFGGVSDQLFNYGVPAGCTADGPSGVRMSDPTIQLPIGTMLSSTWNTKLVKDIYEMVGQELNNHQIDTLLGPGTNIHRNPMNGRNFEYYSEDPVLSAEMALAATGGIKAGGSWGTIKHFALNSQETHRFRVDSVCSERAIREIYLKPFEKSVREGTVQTVMTSYNPINGHWAASNYDLCTTILRGEWGFDGMVMTDWWARMNDVVEKGPESDQDTRDMIRSQNDVYMVVNNNGAEVNSKEDNTEESIAEGRLTLGELQRCAMNICNFIMKTPCIERELVDPDKAEHYKAVPVEDAKYKKFNIADDDKVMFEGESEATMIVDEPGVYTFIAQMAFDRHNLYQATLNLMANDEKMIVLQTSGTDGKWVTVKLCKVELEKGAYNFKLEEVQAGIKVNYLQFKKNKQANA